MNTNLCHLLAEYPLETLLQTIPTGLFLVDTDQVIVYWNAEASRITGYTADEIVGQSCSFLQGDPCHQKCGLFSVATPKPQIGLTCSFQHKDGRTVMLTKNVDLLRDNLGQIIGGIEAFVDISRLKELETDLRLKVAERTRELESFVATVSHDLRSPLTPLIGFTELLEERYGAQLDDVGRESITEIKKTAEKMKDLLDDLLSLSRADQLKIPDNPLNTTRIVEEVIIELAGKIEKYRAKIKISKLPDVKIPESLLTDLFRNLLDNALKYAAEHYPQIEVAGEESVSGVRFVVVDHGLGIAATERQEVFEPFVRGSNSKGTAGTGMGLATVAKIARAFGGYALAEETPGGGATFIIELPGDCTSL